MDPGYMFIANTFDAMRAESVFKQSRALQRFAGDDLAVGEYFLHVIATGDRPCGTRRRGHTAITIIGSHDLLERFFHGVASHFEVPEVIAKLFELVEDHQVLTGFSQFPA